MAHVELDIEGTSLSPELVIGALTDFSERRTEIWPGLYPSLYEVHSLGDTWAEVKEGSRLPGMTVWAIEYYDWSVPDTVTWTVQESNFCAPGSSVSAQIRPGPGGGSRIRVTWDRGGLQGPNDRGDGQAERRQAGRSLDQKGLDKMLESEQQPQSGK